MVIAIMRWKTNVLFFNKNNSIGNSKEGNTEWYGLKSLNSPRKVKELILFENCLVELIRNIKFRKIRNIFQEKLKEDIKLIKASQKTMTSAEKTLNMYQLTKEQPDQLIMNYVTSTYKRANRNINKQISTSEKS